MKIVQPTGKFIKTDFFLKTHQEYWRKLSRHFLRQWLRDPESAWETPADLQDRWDKLYKIEGSDLPYVYALEAPLH